MINKNNTTHYKWGDNCDSWVFLDKEDLSIKLESMPNGTKEKLHIHSKSKQFFYILKGQATFYIENKLKILNENEGIYIQPNERHFVLNEFEKPLDFLVISHPSTNNTIYQFQLFFCKL